MMWKKIMHGPKEVRHWFKNKEMVFSFEKYRLTDLKKMI